MEKYGLARKGGTMKNLLILLVITNLSITPCLSKTVKQYDKYGRVTGYYKETSLGYTEYDRYGKMTGVL